MATIGDFIHPQLVDDLAGRLCARFNIKDVKQVIDVINGFSYGKDSGDEPSFVSFPIGAIQTEQHYYELEKKCTEANSYFNIYTGKCSKKKNKKLYYHEFWCVEPNSPCHKAMLTMMKRLENKTEEKEIIIDLLDDQFVIKDSCYVWSKDLEQVVGVYDEDDQVVDPLDAADRAELKKDGIPFKKIIELD